jgi:hypothetical protein
VVVQVGREGLKNERLKIKKSKTRDEDRSHPVLNRSVYSFSFLFFFFFF